MLTDMTRSRVIQIWFVSVALICAASLAFGANLALSTWSLILAMCLVPPAMLFKLWPDAAARTTAEVIYDAENPR